MSASKRKNGRAFADSAIVRTALDSMPQGVIVFDRDFRVITVNKRYLEIYRLPAAAIRPGVTVRKILELSVSVGNHAGRTADELEQELLQAAHSRSVQVVERTTWEGRTLRITRTPIRDGAWVMTHEDISEMKRHVEALHKHEQEIMLQNATFEFAVRNMRQAMCMYDASDRLAYFNPQYADMYNIPRDCIRVGMSLDEVLKVRPQLAIMLSAAMKPS